MPAIAITGGIASGKSTVTRLMHSALGAEVFDTDACARLLLVDDAEAIAEVRTRFGARVFDPAGRIDRAALRAVVFGEDPAPRRELESILHPRVRAAWRGWMQERLQKTPNALLLVEIPLLCETGAAEFFDHAIVVGCSLSTQLRRLIAGRSLPETTARRIIASQWDLSQKIRLCHYLIWNDGSEAGLHAQAALCAASLLDRYPFRRPPVHAPAPPMSLESPVSSASPASPAPASLPDHPPASASPEAVRPVLPERLDINALHRSSVEELEGLAGALNVRFQPPRPRHALICEVARAALARGIPVTAEGILEMGDDPFGFVRWPEFNFLPCPEDLYVPAALIRQHGLAGGHRVSGVARAGRDKEKYMALERVTAVEGTPIERWTAPKHFDALTPLFPTERIILESQAYHTPTVRAVDLVATLGRGQRGLILAPPRTGKTILLKHIAKAIRAAYPEIHLILLLVDERPEEVTDFKAEVKGEVFSSTFDESPARHIAVAELVSERARRLVELGGHVVILLDSITRLARGYNGMQGGKGKMMSGGLDSKALIKPKKFFSSARKTEEGGSLTILATALVDTGSRADEIIFEEFKGTGNMELHLDRELVDQRVFPAIQIVKSGTRREELLYHPDEFDRVQILRKQLTALPPVEAMEVLLENIEATKSNMELLLAGLRS